MRTSGSSPLPNPFHQVETFVANRIVRQRAKDLEPEFFVKSGRLEIEGVEKDSIAILLERQCLCPLHQFATDAFAPGIFLYEKSGNEKMVPMSETEETSHQISRF